MAPPRRIGATRGRGAELAAIDALLEGATARLGALLIDGAPGIGKTRLLDDAVERAGGRGMAVFAGRAETIGLPPPFWSIAEALGCRSGASDPLRREIAAQLCEVPDDPRSGGALQFRLLDAFTDLVESAALRQPVLLALDDAHRADPSTLLALRTVIRRLAALPVAVVVAYRGTEAGPELRSFVATSSSEGASLLAVEPLDDGAVAAVVADLLGAEAGPGLVRQAAGAGGNPLFLGELLAALAADGRIRTEHGRSDVTELTPSPTLRIAVLRRLDGLSGPAAERLRMAALLGPAFSVEDLCAATGQRAVDLLAVVEEWRRADLVVPAGSSLQFRHDLLRDVFYQDIPEAMRHALHAEVAQRLADAGAPALSVAGHVLLAESTDASAVGWLRRAAGEVAARDPSTAVDLLRRAIAMVPPDGPGWDEVRVELATLLAYGDGPDDAEDLVRGVLRRRHDTDLDDDLRSVLVQSLFVRGRWRDVVDEVEAALGEPTVSERGRARLLTESALARMWVGDVDGAAADGSEALRLGEETGDDVAVSLGLGHLSVVAGARGDLVEGVALARRGLEMASGLVEIERRHPHLAYGMALLAADRLQESKDALQESRRLGERTGTAWDLPLNHAMLALPMLYLGEWDDALAEAAASLASGDETGAGVGRVTALSVIATIAVHRDDLAAAQEALASAEEIIRDRGPQWGAFWLALARAAALDAGGDAEGALRVLEGVWAETTGEGRHRAGPGVVRCALAAGRGELAARVSRELRATPGAEGVPYAEAALLQCDGLVAADPDLLLGAVGLLRATGRVPAVADATADAAVVLAGQGRLEEAGAHFDDALAAFASLGATRDVARVAAAARRAGIHRGVRTPRARATTGWGALTPTEEEVVRLAAQGLTNPQIGERLYISRRTVQTHLSHVYAKLGLSSRVELAGAVARRDP